MSTTAYQPSWNDHLALHAAKLVSGLTTNPFSRALQDAVDRRSTARKMAVKDGYVVSLDGDATVERLCQHWSRHAAALWRGEQRACLDLSNCSFSDVAGPAYLISRITERHRLGLQTSVRLPKQAKEINFLRAVNFLETLATAADDPVSHVLTTESLYRLTRAEPRPLRSTMGRRPTLPFNIFPFKTLRLGSSTRHAPAVRYAAEWLSKHVVAALDRDLAGHGSQVARRVILETLISASSGHDTRSAVVAAYYGLRQAGEDHLQIVFWWDEDPGRPEAAAISDLLDLVVEKPKDLLEASPGEPMGPYEAEQPSSNLTVLASAVIGIFGGSIDAYAADARLTVVKAHRDESETRGLSAKLTLARSYGGGATYGSLVVVTLPLDDQVRD